MGITLRDLLAQPYLSVDLVGGGDGTGTVVTWAHSSDLPDPWNWLSGGELVMKNGRTVPDTKAGQVAFVEGLVAAGAAGLLIGLDDQTPRIAPGTIARCDALGFPLLTVPYSVAFSLVGRAVAEQSVQNETIQLARAGRIYGLLRDTIATADLGAFLPRLQFELACALYLVDTQTGLPVLDGAASLPTPDRRGLLAALDARAHLVPGVLRIPSGRTELLTVDVPYEVATLLVAKPPRPRPLNMATLRHAATACAVILTFTALRAERQREHGAEILSQLLDTHLDEMIARRELAAQHLPPAQARLLATPWPEDRPPRPVSLALTRQGLSHMLLKRGDTLVILLAGPLRDAHLEKVHQVIGADPVGVSNRLRHTWRMPEAMREAAWALSHARAHGQAVAHYGSAPTAMGPRSLAEAQSLVDETLQPLIEYDQQHHGELLTSLEAFLRCNRSWVRTARSLHVHPQTVTYRMRRVEQLTGRNLASTKDIAELWLALTARNSLNGRPATADQPLKDRPT